jgi:hypothetical protein
MRRLRPRAKQLKPPQEQELQGQTDALMILSVELRPRQPSRFPA